MWLSRVKYVCVQVGITQEPTYTVNYASYSFHHFTVTVDSVLSHDALTCLVSSEVWLTGMLVFDVFQKEKQCTFNCRGAKSSLPEVWQLCEMYDIVCIQQLWLLPFELNILSQLHFDCLSWATSAVNISNNLLVGRPCTCQQIMGLMAATKNI